MDITSGLNQVLNLIFNGLTFCFNTLDNIQFLGISLLDFSIWIIVLSLVLPIVVTLLNRGRSASRGYYNERRHNKGE